MRQKSGRPIRYQEAVEYIQGIEDLEDRGRILRYFVEAFSKANPDFDFQSFITAFWPPAEC
jgi:hypothetical protein